MPTRAWLETAALVALHCGGGAGRGDAGIDAAADAPHVGRTYTTMVPLAEIRSRKATLIVTATAP
jgi:hypothetical protein